MKLSVVIPVYNEGQSVLAVVQQAKQALSACVESFEIIVVDDGSEDVAYLETLDSDVKVIRHYLNAGYGTALRSGIQSATHEWVLICDGDGSYDFKNFHIFIKDCDHYDMIVGARQGKFYHGPFFKRFARFMQVSLAQFVTGSKIPDVNSGFRLIRRADVLSLFDFVCRGFSFTTSLTIAMRMMQKQIKFVSIAYHKRKGRSHVKIVRDTLRSLQIITQCILRFNPIKAFILLTLGELFCAAFGAGLLLSFRASVETQIFFGFFWIAIAFITMAIGFMAYAIQSSMGSPGPVDMGMDPKSKEERVEVEL